MLWTRKTRRESISSAGFSHIFPLLILLAICGLVVGEVSGSPGSSTNNNYASLGHDLDAVSRAASASYLEQDPSAVAQLDNQNPESASNPPLLESVRRDTTFPPVELVVDFANQEELTSTQHILPNVLQVTASGLTGIADAGKTLFDDIAQVLQQSQAAWANLQNATNLTRLVQDSLSSSFGDHIFSSPFQLSVNATMQPSDSKNVSRTDESNGNGTFWFEQIGHNGSATYNPNPSTYQVYRNVKDFGAKGE